MTNATLSESQVPPQAEAPEFSQPSRLVLVGRYMRRNKSLAIGLLMLFGLVAFTVIGLMVIFQMGRIQNSEDAQKLKEEKEKQFSFSQELVEPTRGEIFDRWGHLLAGNKRAYEVGVSLLQVNNSQACYLQFNNMLSVKRLLKGSLWN